MECIRPFPAGTCISVNEEVVHGIPGDRILQEGDIVSVDTVTELNGFFGDSAITYAVGEIDEESRRLLEVTEKSREIGIEMAVVGNRIGDIGHAIQSYVEKNGFYCCKRFCWTWSWTCYARRSYCC